MQTKLIEQILIDNNIIATCDNLTRIVNMFNDGYVLFSMDKEGTLKAVATVTHDLIILDGIKYVYYTEHHKTPYNDYIKIDVEILRRYNILNILE